MGAGEPGSGEDNVGSPVNQVEMVRHSPGGDNRPSLIQTVLTGVGSAGRGGHGQNQISTIIFLWDNLLMSVGSTAGAPPRRAGGGQVPPIQTNSARSR